MTAPTMLGHNGPPVFEFGRDLPSDIPKMHFFKCDIQALRKAIFDKPLDIRGAYISVLVAMYEHMEPLPADDAMAMLRTGIKDRRLWNRIKVTLIELGLVEVRTSGRLSNPRFEEEISIYVTEFRNRQRAALEREEKARKARASKPPKASTKTDLPASYAVAKPQLTPSYELANGQLEASYPLARDALNGSENKKTNEINGGNTTIVHGSGPQAEHETRLRARVLELEIELESKKEGKSTAQHRTPAAREIGFVAGATQAIDETAELLRRRLIDDDESRSILSEIRAPSLMMCSDIAGWLQRGADPNLDIIPTVRARVANHRSKARGPIKSWSYFTESVDEARMRRTAPAAKASPHPQSGQRRGSGRPGWRPDGSEFLVEAALIEEENNGVINGSYKVVNP